MTGALTALATGVSSAPNRRIGMNRLATDQNRPHVERAMKRWTARQLIALMLGLMFALGTTLSVVQAADMAVKMSVAGAAALPDSCDGGCEGDDGTGKPCMVMCPNSVQAVIPMAGTAAVIRGQAIWPPTPFASAGRSSHPDPDPPKPVALT